MRVNVYAEELTDDVEVIYKNNTNSVSEEMFMGIRIYLKSSPELHQKLLDDDRSAVTFWVPWTKAKGNDVEALAIILAKAAYMISSAKKK